MADPSNRIRTALLVLATGLAATRLCAGTESRELRNYHHTSWTAENGLGSIFDVQQAPNGYLWLTTSKGIFRFDGVQFQSIDEATNGAVHNKDLYAAFPSRDGSVWLSTRREGMLQWKDGRILEFPDRRCTPGVPTGGIVEDRDGVLWFQASPGLARLKSGVCEPAGRQNGYPGAFPKSIFADSRGTLWVKLPSGALLYLPAGQSKFELSPSGSHSQGEYVYLHESPDGAIWLSDWGGLRRVTDSAGTPLPEKPAGNAHVSRWGNFAFEPDGTLWAATTQGLERLDTGLLRANDGGVENAAGEIFGVPQGLSSEVIGKVTIGREGSVWAGTNEGLDHLRRSALSTIPLPASLKRGFQFGIAAGEYRSIWIGSRRNPLTSVTEDGKVTSFPQTRETTALRRDYRGNIWSGGSTKPGGPRLWQASGTSLEAVHYTGDDVEDPAAMALDRNGDLWVSTFTPRIYHRVSGQWIREDEKLGRKPGVIGAMGSDETGIVWFAFSNKLVRWDGHSYQRHSFPVGPLDVSVATLGFRGDHVWLGGLTGVVLFRRGQFQKMEWKGDDLPGRVTGVIETRSGDLWMNGFSGIVHVRADELKKWLDDPSYAVSAEKLDALDGLPGLAADRWPEPSLVESDEGRLWFATARGVAWLDPAAFDRNRNTEPPPVLITRVTVDGAVYPTSTTLSLPPHTDHLQFDYTALSLAVPERVRFRYKLEGADEHWQEAGTRRQAFYNGLRAAQYRFRVTACNNDGVWSETGASIAFAITPAFYQTSWFMVAVSVMAAFLIWTLARVRISVIRKQFEVRMAERLDERERIARELHDTLLQSLLGLMLQFQHAADRLSGNDTARETLGKALDQAEVVMREGRQRVRSLRSNRGEQNSFVEDLTGIAHQFESLSPAIFQVSVEGRPRPLKPGVLEEVLLLGREALMNAFTHANATAIRLEIAYLRRSFSLTITDDGRGIEEHVLKSGGRDDHWGLTGMRERARKMRADLKIERPPEGGTRVGLCVPGSFAYTREAHLLRRLWSQLHSGDADQTVTTRE